MSRFSSLIIVSCSSIVLLSIETETLHAQSNEAQSWQEIATPRLRAIYEGREFNAKGFAGEWLPDSSGYVVREQDSDTKKQVRVKYDVPSGKRTVLKESENRVPSMNRMKSPDGQHVLEFNDRQLFVRELSTNKRTQLTTRPDNRDLFYRQPIWASDSKHVAFIEADETDVKQRAMLMPTDPSYPEVRNQRFARVGETITRLRVGVVNIDIKDEKPEIQWLPIETPEEGIYLGQVEWAGNTDELLVETMSRFRDKREFLLFDADTEKLKRIYTETNEAWAIGSQETSSGLIWVQGGKAFVVLSEKDGWRHAFLVSREGKELALLTPGEYDIIERAAVDEAGGWFYFYASPNNATQKYLCRVPLDGKGTLERITPEAQPGTHDYRFSPDFKWAFHTWSTFDTPPIVELVELPKHRVVKVLEENSELQAKAKTLISRPTEFLKLDVEDDVTVDAWMIKPREFDPSKKYPVFVYVYSEPYAQTVLDQWGAAQSHFSRVIADLGYLVVSIDSRGTPAPKGAAWRRAIFGSLGPISTEEQAAALKELGRTKPYVDLSRVGIWGWSGGGSNTLNAMFRKPDMYHVGIAVVPKPQPHLYNAWFQEIYMRTREVNPEGYKQSAPINFAEGLKGQLLIVTGSGETNTHIQIIEGLVDRLIELGKPFDYMVYPNRDHGLREGRGSELHVRMLITRYLVEHLPRGPR